MEVIRVNFGIMKKQSFLSVYKHLKATSGTYRINPKCGIVLYIECNKLEVLEVSVYEMV